MKVLIDLTSLADNFSGIERFALSITKELITDQSRSDIEFILVFKNEVHKEFAAEQHNVKKIIVRGKNKLVFNQLQLPLKLAAIKANYYFFPAFPAPFFFFNRNSAIYIDPNNSDVDLNLLMKEPVGDAKYILEKHSWKKSAKEMLKLIGS